MEDAPNESDRQQFHSRQKDKSGADQGSLKSDEARHKGCGSQRYRVKYSDLRKHPQ
ncbi:hypothetical protein D3C75_1203990 [compost metagenome]